MDCHPFCHSALAILASGLTPGPAAGLALLLGLGLTGLVAPAPASITVQMWQAEAVLKATPFLPSQAVPTVQAAVAAATNLWDATEALVVAQGNASLTAFLERSTTLSSNDPTLSSIATALGVTSAQISALFAQASALTF